MNLQHTYAIIYNMLARYLTAQIIKSLQDFPAVLLIGARQVGKSTIAESLVERQIVSSLITLDNLTQLQAVSADPDGFIAQLPLQLAIDEIQRFPDLLRAIKLSIDKHKKATRYLLTGSANVLAQPEVSESLAGRVDVISLEGLLLSEINASPSPPPLIDNLLMSDSVAALQQLLHERLQRPSLSRVTLAQHIFYGGFPDVVIKSRADFAKRWFAAYQTTYIERDIHNLSASIDAIAFNKLLVMSALQTGQLLVINNLANTLGMDQRTVQRYLGLLQLTFQTKLLLPWHVNSKKRLVKTPKIYSVDSGMAAFLNGLASPEELLASTAFGNLAETWAYAELRKLIALTSGVETYFYRTHQGAEVDFLLCRGLRQAGIEFKLAQTVTAKDFNGLKDWQEVAPSNSLGIILYLGDEWVSFSDRLAAVPIKVLS